MSKIEQSMVDAVIASRKSVRAYKKDPVPAELLEHVLDMASRAPSATNMQPWRVYVLTGEALKRLTDAVCAAFDNEPEKHKPEYSYYADPPFEPYLSRRRKVGEAMYSLIGIAREDKVKRHRQQRQNFEFFGAPAGFIFTIDRRLPCVNFIDYGAFFENLMLSAKSHGLDTCLQAFWSDYHLIIREQLSIPPEEMVLAGMAIGYADPEAPVNRLVTDREPVSVFATFLDK